MVGYYAKPTRYSPEEILATHHRYLEHRRRIESGALGWDSLAEFFTDDATFVDPAWGRVQPPLSPFAATDRAAVTSGYDRVRQPAPQRQAG